MDNLDNRESDIEIAKEDEYVTFNDAPSIRGVKRATLGVRELDGKRQRYFFYRHLLNDTTKCFTEAEAGLMMRSSHAPFLRFIGCSDGTTYDKYIASKGWKRGQRVLRSEAIKTMEEALEAEIEAARQNTAKGDWYEPMANDVAYIGVPYNKRPSLLMPE